MCTCNLILIPFWHICWLECQCYIVQCVRTAYVCLMVCRWVRLSIFLYIHTSIVVSFACLACMARPQSRFFMADWTISIVNFCKVSTTFELMNDWLEIEKYLNRLAIPQAPTLCVKLLQETVLQITLKLSLIGEHSWVRDWQLGILKKKNANRFTVEI